MEFSALDVCLKLYAKMTFVKAAEFRIVFICCGLYKKSGFVMQCVCMFVRHACMCVHVHVLCLCLCVYPCMCTCQDVNPGTWISFTRFNIGR